MNYEKIAGEIVPLDLQQTVPQLVAVALGLQCHFEERSAGSFYDWLLEANPQLLDNTHDKVAETTFKLWNLALLELWERIHVDLNHGEGISKETDLKEFVEETGN